MTKKKNENPYKSKPIITEIAKFADFVLKNPDEYSKEEMVDICNKIAECNAALHTTLKDGSKIKKKQISLWAKGKPTNDDYKGLHRKKA
mgnify:CR=1 FL=1